MDQETLKTMLEKLASGKLSVDTALERLTHFPSEDIGFAHVDHHRSIRCGFPEVIFCPGKTTDQIVEIFKRLAKGGGNILATRGNESAYEAVKKILPDVRFNPLSRCIALRQKPANLSTGTVGVICAGTSDVPVAEETRETLEIMDQQVETFYDVGVAGLHRLLAKSARLRQMSVLVVIAGMEGALPSVVGGLVSAPVIAVPTSIGYGASFNGIAALLGMLNSCAANVTVVNIDNGFGAGYVAALINRLAEKQEPKEMK
ncbi:MAG: nickel pincer cofactor biosynthesis protein LarB [Phycisphaerae bacterium]